MSDWTLYRHKAERYGKPAAIYWVQGPVDVEHAWVAIRYPVNVQAPGVDTPAIRTPKHSPSAGPMPASAIRELYEPISVEDATALLTGEVE